MINEPNVNSKMYNLNFNFNNASIFFCFISIFLAFSTQEACKIVFSRTCLQFSMLLRWSVKKIDHSVVYPEVLFTVAYFRLFLKIFFRIFFFFFWNVIAYHSKNLTACLHHSLEFKVETQVQRNSLTESGLTK